MFKFCFSVVPERGGRDVGMNGWPTFCCLTLSQVPPSDALEAPARARDGGRLSGVRAHAASAGTERQGADIVHVASQSVSSTRRRRIFRVLTVRQRASVL